MYIYTIEKFCIFLLSNRSTGNPASFVYPVTGFARLDKISKNPVFSGLHSLEDIITWESILLTIPVAFIYKFLLIKVYGWTSIGIIYSFFQNMPDPIGFVRRLADGWNSVRVNRQFGKKFQKTCRSLQKRPVGSGNLPKGRSSFAVLAGYANQNPL